MARIDLREGEEVEFKRQWTDQALEDIAAFANTRGGRLFIGVEDDGQIVGVATPDAEVQRIANTVVSRLGVNPSVSRRMVEDREIIEVRIEPGHGVVGHNGRYRTRVGSTNRDLSPEALGRLILERSGQTWDALPSPLEPVRVDPMALARFADMARQRLPEIDSRERDRVLQNLGLLREGRLTNAAVLLFADRPQEIFPSARLRIAVLKGTQIVDSHEFTGTLWVHLGGAMERFRRLLKVALDVQVTEPTLEGLRHREVWEYPLDALREAVTNALVHRDYSALGDVQVRLLDDELHIWNPGQLPEGIRLEQLRAPSHPSVLRNPLIARAFYSAGFIEQWGTGTTRIVSWCRDTGLPDPEFHEEGGRFRVIFLKDPYTAERLRAMGLNDRQVKAVQYVKEQGSITNQEYQNLTGASKRTGSRDLEDLVSRWVLERIGQTGRGTRYTLRGQHGARMGPTAQRSRREREAETMTKERSGPVRSLQEVVSLTGAVETPKDFKMTDLADPSNLRDEDDLKARLRRAFPRHDPRVLTKWSNEILAFLNLIQVGDWVLAPLKPRPNVAIGRVTGGYQYRPDLPGIVRHTRPVEWLRWDVPRSAFDRDTECVFRRRAMVKRIDSDQVEQRIQRALDAPRA